MTVRTRGARYAVRGGNALRGSVRISGAKNHVLAAMCASLLTDEDLILQNVPHISDVDSLSELLVSIGARVESLPDGSLLLNGAGVNVFEAPGELITENRELRTQTGEITWQRCID